ncbi:hypothetical protein D3C73_729080 [compost metagenome]
MRRWTVRSGRALGAILDEVHQQLLHPGAIQGQQARLPLPAQGEGDAEGGQHLTEQGLQALHQGDQVRGLGLARALLQPGSESLDCLGDALDLQANLLQGLAQGLL